MRVRSSLSSDQRECLVELFEQGLGDTAAANRLLVRRDPVRKLYRRWLFHGRQCIVEKQTKQLYSVEVKKEVVDRFLAGETALNLAKVFELSSEQLVKNWVRRWRVSGDDGLKPKPKGRPKGRGKPVVLSEEDKLRRENEKLRAENAYLKKLRDLRNQGRG